MFGHQHIRVEAESSPSRYPRPDSYQVLFVARVASLQRFVESDEVAARRLVVPREARRLRWVRTYRPFYELALARARSGR